MQTTYSLLGALASCDVFLFAMKYLRYFAILSTQLALAMA